MTLHQLGQLCKLAINTNPYLQGGAMSRPQPPAFDPSHMFGSGISPQAPAQPAAPKTPGMFSRLGSAIASPFKTQEANPGAWKQTPKGVENNLWSAGRGVVNVAGTATRSPIAIPAAIGADYGIDAAQQKFAPRPEATRNDSWTYNPERFRHEYGYGPESGAQNTVPAAIGRSLSPHRLQTAASMLAHPIRTAANLVPMYAARPYDNMSALWQGKQQPYSPAEVADPFFHSK